MPVSTALPAPGLAAPVLSLTVLSLTALQPDDAVGTSKFTEISERLWLGSAQGFPRTSGGSQGKFWTTS